MIRSSIVFAFLFVVSGSVGAAAVDGNPEAGKQKSAPCAACHGPDGNKTLDGSYPRLAGQYPDYLLKTLRDYKSGHRNNAVMKGFADVLTDKDMADLAVFYSQQPGNLEDLGHLK
jgi:cytochrome c553